LYNFLINSTIPFNGSTSKISTVLGLDSEKIRREIMSILEGEGSMRSKKLAEKVFIEKGIGSEKTVYRELKAMTENGNVRKTGSGYHISYDLPSATEKHRLILFHLLEYAENNFEHLHHSHIRITNMNRFIPLEGLMDIVTGIKQLQMIETRFRIFKLYPGLKKLEDWDNLEKQIEKNWKFIRSLLIKNMNRSGKSDIVGEVLMNFQPMMYGVMTSVEKDVHGPV